MIQIAYVSKPVANLVTRRNVIHFDPVPADGISIFAHLRLATFLVAFRGGVLDLPQASSTLRLDLHHNRFGYHRLAALVACFVSFMVFIYHLPEAQVPVVI